MEYDITMATLQPVNVGDTGLEAKNKINNNDALINSEVGQNTNDIADLKKFRRGKSSLLSSGTHTITYTSAFTGVTVAQILLNAWGRTSDGDESIIKITNETLSGFDVTVVVPTFVNYKAEVI